MYETGDCISGWTYFKHTEGCYKHFTDKVNWDTAKKVCSINDVDQTLNVHLASIPDETTNIFLTKLANFQASWIGGYKNDRGKWGWLDGSDWSYENWSNDPKEPSGDGPYLQLFGHNHGYSGDSSYWNDLDSHHECTVLCQYELVKAKPSANPSYDTSLPSVSSKTEFVLEGGEVLEQTQSFNPNTRELSVSVPSHGDREAVTIIYGEKEMVTAHDTYCLVGEPPKDLNISVYENKKLLPDRPLNHNNVSSVFIFNVIDEDEMTNYEKESLPESFKALCKNKSLRRTSQVTVDKTIFQMNYFNKTFLDSLVTRESTRSLSSLSRLSRIKRTAANSGSGPTEVKRIHLAFNNVPMPM